MICSVCIYIYICRYFTIKLNIKVSNTYIVLLNSNINGETEKRRDPDSESQPRFVYMVTILQK